LIRSIKDENKSKNNFPLKPTGGVLENMRKSIFKKNIFYRISVSIVQNHVRTQVIGFQAKNNLERSQ